MMAKTFLAMNSFSDAVKTFLYLNHNPTIRSTEQGTFLILFIMAEQPKQK